MKNILLLSLAFFTVFVTNAQINTALPLTMGRGGAATTFNRNFDAIGINPSNLGWSDNKLLSVGILGFGWNVQSNSLAIADLKTLFLNRGDAISAEQKETFSALFVDPQGLNYNFNAQWLGASVKIPKIGALAISLNSRTTTHIGLNEVVSDIIFNGRDAAVFQDSATYSKNVGELLDGTNITYTSLREFNVAYGLKLASILNDKLEIFGGIGFKYIWGMGNLTIKSEDGIFVGRSSFSNNAKDINYNGILNFDPQEAENLFNAPGQGYGFDIGGSIKLGGAFRAGISIVDIGSIEWTTNVLVAKDTTIQQPADNGSEDFSWKEQAEYIYSKDGVLKMEEGKSYSTKLPTRIRIGAGIKASEMFQIGVDFIAPINNDEPAFDKASLILGLQVNLVGLLKVSSGVNLNQQYGTSIPIGVTLGLFGKLEAGFAFGDLLTIINGTDNPNASAAIGMLRINL
ncbi:MAG: hypothetical protein ACI8ZO_001647 [Flavobacteriales bacterium]|jgi:hypothetical protein